MSVIFVQTKDVATAWIELLRRVVSEGDRMPTSYDRPSDSYSFDSTVMCCVEEPFSNPIQNVRIKAGKERKTILVKTIHNNVYEMYGHIGDRVLRGAIQSGYIEDILQGTSDYQIEKEEGAYTYHDRIFRYSPYAREDVKHVRYAQLIGNDIPRVDQLELAIKELEREWYSRRSNIVTWRPLADPFRGDPPCLQRIYFRVKGIKPNARLIMQTCWRSRDLFKAWQSNVNVMIRLQKMVAERLNMEVGKYVEFCNSLHIYGQDYLDVQDLFERIRIEQSREAGFQ